MTRRTYVDRSDEFWPTGWAVWFSIVLGVIDVGLVVFIIAQVVRR